MDSRADEAGAQGPELSPLPSRLMKVFVAPGELFEELREEPAWLGALLVVVGASLAFSLLLPEDIMREAMVSQARTQGGGEIPADQLEQMITFGKWMAYVGSVLGPFLVAAVVAGFMMFTFNLVLGGEASYRQLFSAASHALVITAVGGLATLPLILSTGDMSTSLSLHLLVPGLEEGTYAHRFLAGLNVFSLAAAGVLGVAASRLYPNREAGGAASIMVGAYVAFAAVAAIFGGLAPGA